MENQSPQCFPRFKNKFDFNVFFLFARQKVIKICENMAELTHHNLVLFHGVQFNDDQNTYLAFEWLNSGTLDEYLKT